jgi:2-polyprenyl-3-methyl-5-hydroxy-6-metoxy-1,4-benzoquinol methylase
MKCRHCDTDLERVFVDLQYSPPCNAMLKAEQLNEPEVYFPLKIFVCENCYLVQVDEVEKAANIFDHEYTYFSSYSSSWLAHAKKYVDMMMGRFDFGADSLVIEIASNDGYLLQYFKEHGVPVLGVDPTANTAEVARQKGIETVVDFFGSDFAARQLVNQGIKGDLILGNNVLAHVPDINDFVKGMKAALKENGIITMEFPHLMRLVEETQFDTIYHEHYSYLSFAVVKRIFAAQGLEIFDVDELPTHGGSLRIYAKHEGNATFPTSQNVMKLLEKEMQAGMNTPAYYEGFQERVNAVKYGLLSFFLEQRRLGKKVIGYGAAGKGNTLLNYCVKGNDLIRFVVDASPHKQNKYLPGSHIPVVDAGAIREYKPDYIVILPWNLKAEISGQFSYVKEWGCRFVVPIPETTILE